MRRSLSGKLMVEMSGSNGNDWDRQLLCIVVGHCYYRNFCTTVTSVWTYYVKIENISYLVISGEGGGERSSTSWLCCSSQHEGFSMRIVEVSCT